MVLSDVRDAAGTASVKQLTQELRVAYNPDQPRDEKGEFSGTTGEKKDRNKVAKARASHKPATAEKQRWAEGNQASVASMTGGKPTEGQEPMDIIGRVGNQKYGIELKTILEGRNDKVTVHPSSKALKDKWARKTNATTHMVVMDDRKLFGAKGYSGHRIYYRSGVGSYRLHTMTKVKSSSHLKQLLSGK